MKFSKLIKTVFSAVLLLYSCHRADYKLYSEIKLQPTSRKGSLASKRNIQSLLYEIWDSGFLAKNDLTKQEILNNTYGVFYKAKKTYSEPEGRAFYQQRTAQNDILMLNANLFSHLKLPPKPGRMQKSLISRLDELIRDTLVHELYHDFWHNILDQRRKNLFAIEAEIFFMEIELMKANPEANRLQFLQRIGFDQPEIDYFDFFDALLDLKPIYNPERLFGTELYATLAGRAFSGATIIPQQFRKYYLSVVSDEALCKNQLFSFSDTQNEDKKDRDINTQDFPQLKLPLEEQPELIDIRDKNGWYLLHHASYTGNEEAIRFLVEKGAKVNARAKTGAWTPLFLALLKGHTEIVEWFIRNGASIDLKDSRDRSPLHIAAMSGHQEIIDLLLNKGIEVNLEDATGMTPLHTAALYGKGQTASLLLSRGANVEVTDLQGQTPLHLASLDGNRDLAELLIAEGVNVNKKDFLGETALHVAAFCGHKSIVELLIESGANLDIRNANSQTPMDLASKAGRRQVAEVLRSSGLATF